MSRNALAPDRPSRIGAGRSGWGCARRWAAALLLWAALPAPIVAAPTAEEQAAITQINVRRGQVGLPPLTHNSNLEQAARGHANYLATNNTTGHIQTSTAPGYTGDTPFDRISLTYGTHAVSNEVISFGASTGVAAVDGLIQAIYHRFGIFSSRVQDTGVGVVTVHPMYGTVFVVNSALKFDTPPGPGSGWVGVYPYETQTGVPRSFLSDTESPDPVPGPGANKVGYPISIQVEDDKALAVSTFSVSPVIGGVVQPALTDYVVLSAATDPANTPASAAAYIPRQPLEYGAEYEVQFSGTADVTTPVTRTWRFTTAPLLPITFSPAQPYVAYNSTLEIQISGGSGNYVQADSSFLLPKPADAAISGSTLRITSPSVIPPGTGTPSSGSLTVTVTDDEGNTGQVVIQVQETVDSTPNAFSFPAVTGAALSTVVQSASIPVSGITVPTAISVVGGEYSINNNPSFTNQPGTVVNGDTVRVRLTSSPIGFTTTSATLIIGSVSALFSVTTLDNLVPSVPTGLAISNLGANSLTVSWSASGDVGGGVTAYRVFRGGVFRTTVTAPDLSFDDSGLTAATPYSYTVAACDAAGNCSAQSLSVSATTLDNLPPLAPTGLGITNLAANSLTLNWSASTDNVGVTAYGVFREGVFRATVTGATSFNDSGLAAATPYSYTVRACDAALNCSAQSASVSATTLDNLPPLVPAGLGINNLTANSLTLNWSASTDNVGVTAYRVLRNGSFRATVTGATSFNDSGLTTITLYSYTVAACDAAGNCSGPSAAISATTLDNVPPAPPASLTATAVSGTQIDLAWSGSSDNVGVTAYGVYRGGVFRATVNAPTTSFSDTTVVNATPYSYTVRACDAAGNCSAQSPEAFATTPDTQAPSVPTGLTATAVSASRINLAWNASGDNVGVAAYRVSRDGTFRATVNAPALVFGDTGLSAATLYSYTVAACDAAGNCSAPSVSASASTLAAGQYVYEPQLVSGFNLLGNSLSITIDVAATFGNLDAPVDGVSQNIASVWKWIKTGSSGHWAFYSPLMTVQGIADYAGPRNYDVLATINPGEGYWVNAAVPIALPAQAGTGINWDGSSFATLPSGFNLITAADSMAPNQFNLLVNPTTPPEGVVPTGNFYTLWAWDAVNRKWYYYSPLQESTGGLTEVCTFAHDRNYKCFDDDNKMLDVGVGFWVNRP